MRISLAAAFHEFVRLGASSRLRSIATSTRPDLELIDRGTEVKDGVQIWRGGTHVESANRGLRNRRDLNAHSRRPGNCRHRIRDLSLRGTVKETR